jgi:LuxR family maltose regulon positive regulatory protein
MPGRPEVSTGSTLPAQRLLDDATEVPRLPRVYVPRARLWTQLEDVTASGVTLVVAPVGAGKTLGVAGWLRATDRAAHTTWIHADPTWSPDRLEELLAAPDQGEPPARPLLVVDDAHQLPTSTLRLLDEWLDRAPDSLRLVLLSRWDLPLSRLVPELMGQLSVLRGDVLRMDDEECVPLVAEHARTDHPEVIRSVIDRSNGWAAAVVLASRAIAASPDAVTTARRYAEGDASIADRLASEVFAVLQSRERHLLLCVANEEVVTTEDAVHLSHDARAGEILADLETTGLLVTRLPADPFEPGPARYRIHPLLIEVVRRRLVAGGVDVAQAQGTILRAVRLDLARGEIDRAFGRLVAADEPEEAARVLAEEGVALLMRGQGSAVAAFARLHPETVEAAPGTWFALGLERWLDNDAGGSGHWLDRVMADAKQGGHRDALCPRVACTRLIRARMGSEPLMAAIGHARKVVLAHMSASTPEPLMPLLLGELGMAQAWMGDLTEAEVNLTNAIALSRSRGLTRLITVSLSHLALTLYMQGRESACIEIANDALEQLSTDAARPGYVRARAALARELAMLCDVPWPQGMTKPETSTGTPTPLHIGDPVGRFWARLRDARLALMSGSVSAAEQILEVPPTWFTLPEHLSVILVLERGFLASLAGDPQALRSWAVELVSLGARGEAALLTGLRHELESDRKAALASYAVAQEDVTYSQPASRALALTCEAQLLDVMGRSDDAIDRLREAATLTEVRRNAVPFLGWSRQGTPIVTLLERLEAATPTAWIHELAAAATGRPDIATAFAPTTATPRERTQASDPTVRPSLSAREREVLNELARGATYADIAAELFVSENTVKTHVSSLYGKLAVTRRSEALAVARNLHLL